MGGHEEAFRGGANVGLGVRAAHEAAAMAFEMCGPIREVKTLLLVRVACTVGVEISALLRALACDRDSLGIPGTAL